MEISVLGHGRPLVLLHGWAMHSGIWGELIERMSAQFELHCVDLPGHGRSMDDPSSLQPDALAEAIRQQIPENAIWMGWSLGGMIALKAAIQSPSSVAALVPVAASPRFTKTEDWPHGVDESVISQFESDLRQDFEGTLKRFLALEVHGCDTERQDLRVLRRTAFEHGAPDPRVLAEGLAILHHLDLRDQVGVIECPTLFIAGRRDRLVPWQGCEAAAQLINGADCKVIPGAGHAPFIGHPNQFMNHLLAFTQTLQ